MGSWKKYVLTLLLVATCGLLLRAQAVVVQNATSQGWAGGVCCAHGVNYVIQLRVSLAARDFRIDSVYVGQNFWEGVSGKSPHIVFTEDSHGKTYTLSYGITWGNRRGIDMEDIVVERTPSPVHYEGEALIVYHAAGKRHRLVIPNVKELVPIAYP